MENNLSALVIGAGDRGNAFAKRASTLDLGINILGIAETNIDRREEFVRTYSIQPDHVFELGEEALNQNNPYDLVYIATQDKIHKNLAVLALNKGYNVLLEKPMATSPRDCIAIQKAQEKSGKLLAIAHVLRYAPFFQELKKLTSSSELGKLVGIDLTERVGYWHFAHSYVRGNWARSEDSSPVILAKSCHDLDIISWLADAEANSVLSRGSLAYFNSANSPSGSKSRCSEGCPVKTCVFDARKFYLNVDGTRWPFSTISQDHSEKGRKNSIKEGPYGRCVYNCDNDVCDNQDVSIEFKNGVWANFRLRSHGSDMTRRINLIFERGEVGGDLHSGIIRTTYYSGRRGEDQMKFTPIDEKGGHGGGDPLLMKSVKDSLILSDPGKNLTSAQQSLQSHLLAFAAEESRKTGKQVNFQKYLSKFKR